MTKSARQLKKTKKIFLVFSLVFIFSACRSAEINNQSEAPAPAVEESFSIPPPNINLAKQLEISQKPEDIQLAKKIDEII